MLRCLDRAGDTEFICPMQINTEESGLLFYHYLKYSNSFLFLSPQQHLWFESVLAALSSPELHLLVDFCTQFLPLFHNWLVCSSSLALHPSSYFPSLMQFLCPLPPFLLLECKASLQKNRRSLSAFAIPLIIPSSFTSIISPRWWDKYSLAFILRLVKLAYSLLFLFHLMMWNRDNSTHFSAAQGWAQFEEKGFQGYCGLQGTAELQSHCCVLTLSLFDCDKLLLYLLLLKIWKTKMKSDLAIDEYREVNGAKEHSLSKGIVVHWNVLSHYVGVFSACWRGTGRGDFCVLRWHLVWNPPKQFLQLYGNCVSQSFKDLRTPVGSWILWDFISSLHGQISRPRVPWACKSISETMYQKSDNIKQ